MPWGALGGVAQQGKGPQCSWPGLERIVGEMPGCQSLPGRVELSQALQQELGGFLGRGQEVGSGMCPGPGVLKAQCQSLHSTHYTRFCPLETGSQGQGAWPQWGLERGDPSPALA